jgi:hypothetical protein
MTATLTLAPLSSEECTALLLLKKKGKKPPTAHPVPEEELERARNTITLKLCPKPIIGECFVCSGL